ncbi:hypothetical protein THAOC_27957, partial [Thalassiosira oceanica]
MFNAYVSPQQQILPTRALERQGGFIRIRIAPDEKKQPGEPLLDSSDGDKRTFQRFGQYSSADEPAGMLGSMWCFFSTRLGLERSISPTSAAEHDSIPPAVKRLRAYIAKEIDVWEMTSTFLSYIVYVALVALTVAYDSPLIERSEKTEAIFYWTGFGLFMVWILIQLLDGVYVFVGGSFYYLWNGRAVVFEFIALVMSIVFFSQAFKSHRTDHFQWRYGILITMSLAAYVQKSSVGPLTEKLHLYFNGVATEGELKQSKKGQGPPLVKGI